MSNVIARALLREIPLSQIELYLDILDSGVLKAQEAAAKDNGNWCGAGCHDGLGHVCGLSCAHAALQVPGSVDENGQLGITREDLDAAVANPTSMRHALMQELRRSADAMENQRGPTLGPKVDARLYVDLDNSRGGQR
jgi:hypothetical protein